MKEEIELADHQRAILGRRYDAWREAQEKYEAAERTLDDLCQVLAGEEYELDPTDGTLRLWRKGEG